MSVFPEPSFVKHPVSFFLEMMQDVHGDVRAEGMARIMRVSQLTDTEKRDVWRSAQALLGDPLSMNRVDALATMYHVAEARSVYPYALRLFGTDPAIYVRSRAAFQFFQYPHQELIPYLAQRIKEETSSGVLADIKLALEACGAEAALVERAQAMKSTRWAEETAYTPRTPRRIVCDPNSKDTLPG